MILLDSWHGLFLVGKSESSTLTVTGFFFDDYMDLSKCPVPRYPPWTYTVLERKKKSLWGYQYPRLLRTVSPPKEVDNTKRSFFCTFTDIVQYSSHHTAQTANWKSIAHRFGLSYSHPLALVQRVEYFYAPTGPTYGSADNLRTETRRHQADWCSNWTPDPCKWKTWTVSSRKVNNSGEDLYNPQEYLLQFWFREGQKDKLLHL